MRWRRVLGRVGIGMVVVLLALQLVPYGWQHPNPSVIAAAPLSGRAAELVEAACADCHSNETDWPIYSYVAPMSWLVRHDVEEGREAFNLSDWDEFASEADDAAEETLDGDMPPRQYELAHPDARLSAEERSLIAAAFEQIDEGGSNSSGPDGDDDG